MHCNIGRRLSDARCMIAYFYLSICVCVCVYMYIYLYIHTYIYLSVCVYRRWEPWYAIVIGCCSPIVKEVAHLVGWGFCFGESYECGEWRCKHCSLGHGINCGMFCLLFEVLVCFYSLIPLHIHIQTHTTSLHKLVCNFSNLIVGSKHKNIYFLTREERLRKRK